MAIMLLSPFVLGGGTPASLGARIGLSSTVPTRFYSYSCRTGDRQCVACRCRSRLERR